MPSIYKIKHEPEVAEVLEHMLINWPKLSVILSQAFVAQSPIYRTGKGISNMTCERLWREERGQNKFFLSR